MAIVEALIRAGAALDVGENEDDDDAARGRHWTWR